MKTEFQEEDIYTVIKSLPHLKTFAKILAQTNLEHVLRQSKALTVFAPNDNAFAKWPQKNFAELFKDTTRARDFLAYHLAEPAIFLAGLAVPKIIQSLQGEFLSLNPVGKPTVNNVLILEPDIAAVNGVIHVIYKVLDPHERV